MGMRWPHRCLSGRVPLMIFPDPFAKVAEEIAARDLDQALWVQSWAESGGDYDRATAIYIRLRVAQIRVFNEEAARITERTIIAAQKKQREAARIAAQDARANARVEAQMRRDRFWEEHGLTIIAIGLLGFFAFLFAASSSHF